MVAVGGAFSEFTKVLCALIIFCTSTVSVRGSKVVWLGATGITENVTEGKEVVVRWRLRSAVKFSSAVTLEEGQRRCNEGEGVCILLGPVFIDLHLFGLVVRL